MNIESLQKAISSQLKEITTLNEKIEFQNNGKFESDAERLVDENNISTCKPRGVCIGFQQFATKQAKYCLLAKCSLIGMRCSQNICKIFACRNYP